MVWALPAPATVVVIREVLLMAPSSLVVLEGGARVDGTSDLWSGEFSTGVPGMALAFPGLVGGRTVVFSNQGGGKLPFGRGILN